jgi:hypothetical protein
MEPDWNEVLHIIVWSGVKSTQYDFSTIATGWEELLWLVHVVVVLCISGFYLLESVIRFCGQCCFFKATNSLILCHLGFVNFCSGFIVISLHCFFIKHFIECASCTDHGWLTHLSWPSRFQLWAWMSTIWPTLDVGLPFQTRELS